MKITKYFDDPELTNIKVEELERLIESKEILEDNLKKSDELFAIKHEYFLFNRIYYTKKEFENEIAKIANELSKKLGMIESIVNNENYIFMRKHALNQIKKIIER